MHILNFVRPLRVDRPSCCLLSLQRSLIHVPDTGWQLSLLKGIISDGYLLSILILSSVINDLFVEPFLILLESVLMLAFKSHLHLFIGICDQMGQFFDVFRVCY
jgi:hypothetical protein